MIGDIDMAAIRTETRAMQHLRDTYSDNDVLFSYHAEIPENPPQLLAISQKRVYHIASPAEAERFVAPFAGAHIVYLDKP
jgi:hypothetical protein